MSKTKPHTAQKKAGNTPAQPQPKVATQEKIKKSLEKPKDGTEFFSKDAIIFLALSLVAFGIIRVLFPTPDYIPDSKGYMLAAVNGAEVGYRPVGISVFLNKMHKLNPTLEFVACIQYLLHALSGLAIAHAFRRLFHFNNINSKILYAICLLNPSLLYLANTITSDSLFCSFTIGYIAFALYMIRDPKLIYAGLILVLLWLAMFIRYNALIYPIITIAALIFTRNKVLIVAGSVLCILATWTFYTTTKDRMEEATGVAVFSGFSGWQLGSNAMKAYKTLDKRGIQSGDADIQWLDSRANVYIDSINKADPTYKKTFETDFIWHANAPFQQYQYFLREKKMLNQFSSWTEASVKIQEYGKAVIAAYPGAFFTAYLIPNAINFFFPPLVALDAYQADDVKLFPQIMAYYGLDKQATTTHKKLPEAMNKPMQMLYLLLSVAFLPAAIIILLRHKQYNISRPLMVSVIFVAIFWLCKLGFETFAAPLELRYVIMTTPFIAGVVLIAFQLMTGNKKAAEVSAAN